MYEDFKDWFSENNPKRKIPSNREFVKEIKKYIEVHANVKVDGKPTTGIKNLKIVEYCN